MTDEGKRRLLELGIKRVFDLRSVKEVQRLAKDEIFIIPGVEIVSVPALVIAKGEQMGNTFKRFECGTDEPFMESYGDILCEGTASFKTIFEFLRDHLSAGDGCLIHCTGQSIEKRMDGSRPRLNKHLSCSRQRQDRSSLHVNTRGPSKDRLLRV